MNALISPDELASLLEVPVTWVYRAARLGIIPSVCVGKYKRFDYAEVRRAINEHWNES
jgi:excisionase family DNA binding protein